MFGEASSQATKKLRSPTGSCLVGLPNPLHLVVKHGSFGVPAWHIAQAKWRKENTMKKYLIAAAFILCAPANHSGSS